MQLLRLLLTLTLAVLAPATVPAPQPHNVLTIKVYTTYSRDLRQRAACHHF